MCDTTISRQATVRGLAVLLLLVLATDAAPQTCGPWQRHVFDASFRPRARRAVEGSPSPSVTASPSPAAAPHHPVARPAGSRRDVPPTAHLRARTGGRDGLNLAAVVPFAFTIG